MRDRYQDAADVFNAARPLLADDRRATAHIDLMLGQTRRMLGDFATARQLVTGAVKALSEEGDRLGEAFGRTTAGAMAIVAEERQVALLELDAASTAFRELADPSSEGRALRALASLLSDLGDLPGAESAAETLWWCWRA